MTNAKELDLTKVGLAIDLVADPGGGKSHFARSAIKHVTALGKKAVGLLAPLAEALSYAGVDFEYPDDFVDPAWDPANRVMTTNMDKVMERELQRWEKMDDLGLVVLDTTNAGPSEALWRRVVAEAGTDDFTALGGNARQPYVTYASRMTRLMDRLDLLRWRKNCHVIKLWHQDIREFEGAGTARKESEKTQSGFRTVVHWDSVRLPELKGQIMRQSILKWCDVGFYCEPVVGSNPHRCQLKVLPDGTRLAKTRLPILSALQKMPDVPNDFGKLMQVIQANGGAGK